jgi:hypothetical protein
MGFRRKTLINIKKWDFSQEKFPLLEFGSPARTDLGTGRSSYSSELVVAFFARRIWQILFVSVPREMQAGHYGIF